ncbi:MAG: lipocalin family protein [Methylococcales bacterium]|nr:lipocalin family protein [Methylococcales bacterium]
MSNNNKIRRKYKTRRIPKRYFIFAGLLAIACGLGVWFFYEVSGLKPAEVWFETKAAAASPILLPKDDAPHKTKIEWWSYNGHLNSKSGKKFSFHNTIFLVTGLTSQIVGHVSLNDLQTGIHYTDQRKSDGNSTLIAYNRFDFTLGNWIMKGQNGADELKVSSKNFSFNLNLTSTLAPVVHGNNGLIPMSLADSSYYYSRTRMPISGWVKIGKQFETVEGIGWFDHQWGNFITGKLAWDWFGLQLDDGADIMIYNLRDKANKSIHTMASFTQNGLTELLSDADFTLTPGVKWTSTETGITYPIEWNIKIPKKNVAIITQSIVNNSEFDAKLTTYNTYWEGAVKVTGSNTGQGFMNLSGYTAKQ